MRLSNQGLAIFAYFMRYGVRRGIFVERLSYQAMPLSLAEMLEVLHGALVVA